MKLKSRDTTPRCGFCHDLILDDDVAICDKGHAPVHTECLELGQICPVQGCRLPLKTQKEHKLTDRQEDRNRCHTLFLRIHKLVKRIGTIIPVQHLEITKRLFGIFEDRNYITEGYLKFELHDGGWHVIWLDHPKDRSRSRSLLISNLSSARHKGAIFIFDKVLEILEWYNIQLY